MENGVAMADEGVRGPAGDASVGWGVWGGLEEAVGEGSQCNPCSKNSPSLSRRRRICDECIFLQDCTCSYISLMVHLREHLGSRRENLRSRRDHLSSMREHLIARTVFVPPPPAGAHSTPIGAPRPIPRPAESPAGLHWADQQRQCALVLGAHLRHRNVLASAAGGAWRRPAQRSVVELR